MCNCQVNVVTLYLRLLIKFDNQGTWNLRSQDAESWYLGQELYLELKLKSVGEDDPSTIPEGVAAPIPENIIKCGRKACLFITSLLKIFF